MKYDVANEQYQHIFIFFGFIFITDDIWWTIGTTQIKCGMEMSYLRICKFFMKHFFKLMTANMATMRKLEILLGECEKPG